jgi:hypothetical protein
LVQSKKKLLKCLFKIQLCTLFTTRHHWLRF